MLPDDVRVTDPDATAVLGGGRQIARVIPNEPSLVGAGFNPVTFGKGATSTTRELVLGLFPPLGAVPEVADEDLEAYAILNAMGPTYLWSQLYALVDVAGQIGLAPDDAARAVGAMVADAWRTIAEAGLSTDEVQDLVPVKPFADAVGTMTSAYGDVSPGLHARLSGKAPQRA